jgi:GalNAc-alpha-(1->4)-GalNAc-alpha-(1->3)-diNAcBac-PP-undecaprenol alpha-1,4-N-acetyl-D-galactosaminyltransferase
MGGAQRVAVALCNYWHDQGHEVTLVGVSAPDKTCAFKVRDGIKVIALERASRTREMLPKLSSQYQKVQDIRAILKHSKSARIITFMTHVNILVLLAGFGLRQKIIVSERAYPPLAGHGLLINFARRLLYPSAHRVVMQTTEGMIWLERNVSGARGALIHNPVEQSVENDLATIPDSVLEKHEMLVLAVGRLEHEKNFKLLIECFATAELSQSGWKLAILGEGSQRSLLEAKIRELELIDSVFLPGSVENLSVWYSRADIFAMTSRYEGFPNALLEAMSFGNAVISIDCKTGPSELIEHGYNGFLVSEQSGVEGFTSQLKYLATNPGLRARFVERSLYVNSEFALSHIAEQWLAAFGEG